MLLRKAKYATETGEKDVAKALMCGDKAYAEAYKAVGRPCPADVVVVKAPEVAPVKKAEVKPATKPVAKNVYEGKTIVEGRTYYYGTPEAEKPMAFLYR